MNDWPLVSSSTLASVVNILLNSKFLKASIFNEFLLLILSAHADLFWLYRHYCLCVGW